MLRLKLQRFKRNKTIKMMIDGRLKRKSPRNQSISLNF
jgi:hypothetical protein